MISWFTNFEQAPLECCQQLPLRYILNMYVRLFKDIHNRQTADKLTSFTNKTHTHISQTKDRYSHVPITVFTVFTENNTYSAIVCQIKDQSIYTI